MAAAGSVCRRAVGSEVEIAPNRVGPDAVVRVGLDGVRAVREAADVSVVRGPAVPEVAVGVRVRRVGQGRDELRVSGARNAAAQRGRGGGAAEADDAGHLGRQQHEDGGARRGDAR